MTITHSFFKLEAQDFVFIKIGEIEKMAITQSFFKLEAPDFTCREDFTSRLLSQKVTIVLVMVCGIYFQVKILSKVSVANRSLENKGPSN